MRKYTFEEQQHEFSRKTLMFVHFEVKTNVKNVLCFLSPIGNYLLSISDI